MTKCLSGKWVIRMQGSDYVPGLDQLAGMPFSVLINNDSDSWLSISQKASAGLVEEAIFTCSAAKTETRAYQIGKANYECVDKGRHVFAFPSVDEEFSEFSVLRVGPGVGQRSEERYCLNDNGDEIRVTTDISSENGNFKVVRYLVRVQGSAFVPAIEFSQKAVYNSNGWLTTSYRSREVLSAIIVSLLEPYSVVTPSDKDKGKAAPVGNKNYVISKRFGSHVSAGETVTVYEVLVKKDMLAWISVHRYREFLALKNFIDQEMKDLAPPTKPLPPFPGKSIRSLHGLFLERRHHSLETYMNALMKVVVNGYGSRNVVDAICGFLEVPNNMLPAPRSNTDVAPSTGAGEPDHPAPVKTTFLRRASAIIVSGVSTKAPKPPQEPAVLYGSSQPADILYSVLSRGIGVIKHGRSGKPKSRILLCNNAVSRLYWTTPSASSVFSSSQNGIVELPHESKSISLMQVTDVRSGTDGDLVDPTLMGSAALRRNCPSNLLSMCISLVLPDRTFDIQCNSVEDFNVLYPNLVSVCTAYSNEMNKK